MEFFSKNLIIMEVAVYVMIYLEVIHQTDNKECILLKKVQLCALLNLEYHKALF